MLTHKLTVEKLWIASCNAPAWLVLARGFLPATGKTPIRPLAKLLPDAGWNAAGQDARCQDRRLARPHAGIVEPKKIFISKNLGRFECAVSFWLRAVRGS